MELNVVRMQRKQSATSVNELGSIPMGNVPTCAILPSNSTPFGTVGRPRMRVHEDKKCRA